MWTNSLNSFCLSLHLFNNGFPLFVSYVIKSILCEAPRIPSGKHPVVVDSHLRAYSARWTFTLTTICQFPFFPTFLLIGTPRKFEKSPFFSTHENLPLDFFPKRFRIFSIAKFQWKFMIQKCPEMSECYLNSVTANTSLPPILLFLRIGVRKLQSKPKPPVQTARAFSKAMSE